jgi:hypothetical protein
MLEELSDTNSFLGISFISSTTLISFFLMLALFYGVYRGFGGEKSPGALLLDSFGCGSGGDDRGVRRSTRPLHLSHAMDDSNSSVSTSGSTRGFRPQRNPSAYSGLNTSSSHGPSGASPSSKFKPRQQYVPKGPPRPTYAASNSKGGGGIYDL